MESLASGCLEEINYVKAPTLGIIVLEIWKREIRSLKPSDDFLAFEQPICLNKSGTKYKYKYKSRLLPIISLKPSWKSFVRCLLPSTSTSTRADLYQLLVWSQVESLLSDDCTVCFLPFYMLVLDMVLKMNRNILTQSWSILNHYNDIGKA